ncbi:uncharacterized protein LOC135809627 [Sycon ciliatum]|uniref:uncharacterized protein LOC135809627 n=1 Tax=Sycon ciliatum TaxID=27933 RepID=UPI0031F6DF55
MSLSAAVSSMALADGRPPHLTNGMATTESTTYASIASMNASPAEFIPSRATRPSNNPILRDANIDGRSIVQQKGLYCRPSRHSPRHHHQHHPHAAESGNGGLVGDQVRTNLDRRESTAEYIALEFAHNQPRNASQHPQHVHSNSTTGLPAMDTSGWSCPGSNMQEARGLQPSAQYMNLVQLNDSKQAHAWFGGSAHAAELAVKNGRQPLNNGHGVHPVSSSAVPSATHSTQHNTCGLSNAGSAALSTSGKTASKSGAGLPQNNCIYVNSSVVTSNGGEQPAASKDVTLFDKEPVYINAIQTPSGESLRPPNIHTRFSSTSSASPAISPLTSPGGQSTGASPARTGLVNVSATALSPSSASSAFDMSQHKDYMERTYENASAQASRPSGPMLGVSHMRSPSEPCHITTGASGQEAIRTRSTHSNTMTTPGQPIYMNDASGGHHLSRRSRSSSSLHAEHTQADFHSQQLPKTAATSCSSPSSPSKSPIASPCREEVEPVMSPTFQASNADTLFGKFQLTFLGAEAVDRGYGVIPQVVRSVAQRSTPAVTRNVIMAVSATSVTISLDDGTEKLRHEVDSIESISAWQDSSTPVPADLAKFVAYVVVQEGVSAACFVFEVSDAASRRTVCKTIESALYADVKNFKSMTYPRYEIQAKVKSASQFSVKYVGSVLVQTTFSVIDEAAKRLLSSTNPAKINFAFMDVGEDRIRLTGITNSVIFAAHPTSSIASLNVFSEDGRVFGYVVKQKGSGTKCHVFRCSRPSLAFAIVDIIKDVIQDNYKTNDIDEPVSKSDVPKSNGLRGFLARRREKRSHGNGTASIGHLAVSSPSKTASSAEPAAANADSRNRSVSDITAPASSAFDGSMPSSGVLQHRVDYLGSMVMHQDEISNTESRQVVEKMNSARNHSYILQMSISDRGIYLCDDHHKTKDIATKSIQSVRLHPENSHYALLIARPDPNSTERHCHVLHQISRTADDIVRDVTRLLVCKSVR